MGGVGGLRDNGLDVSVARDWKSLAEAEKRPQALGMFLPSCQGLEIPG
jgi:hypothetical protein